jgi:hypothetical protein
MFPIQKMKIFLHDSLAAILRKIIAENEASVLLGCSRGSILTSPADAQLPNGWRAQGWILVTVQLMHEAHSACGGTSATPAIFYHPLSDSTKPQRAERIMVPVTMYVHRSEATELRALAEEKGISQSAFMRWLFLRHTGRDNT